MKQNLIFTLTVALLSIITSGSLASDTAWVKQSSGITQYTTSVFFLNQSTGWATADQGVMLKTTNGGVNWSQLSSGTGNALYSVKFFDQFTGWASGSGGTLLKTTNGGNNWIMIDLGVTHTLKVFFLNSQTGWLYGSGTPPMVMATTNGGLNWVQHGVTMNGFFTDIYFANQNSGWMTTTEGDVLRTTNGGVNWTLQNVSSAGLFSVYFQDSLTGWVVGLNGRVGRTTNGGVSWIVQILPVSGIFLSVRFINSTTGWLCGGGGRLYVSTNGGANWTSQLHPAPTQDLTSIFFTGTYGWACGTNGTMIHTSSGGFPLPSSPTNLSASVVSASQVNLSWTDSSNNEQYFKIERSTNGTNWVLIDSVNSNVTIYQNSGLAGGTVYYYRVYASSWWGNSQPTQSVSVLTFPVPPALFSPTNNSTGISVTPQIIWLSVPSATGYRLQVSADSLFSITIINDSTITQTQYNIQSGLLNNNNRYYWRIRAKNSSGWGGYSTVWNFTTGMVGINPISAEIPKEYMMYNNYPNPFNPLTKIKFDIPEPSFTKITVFDISGKEIKTLVNENLGSGKYEISFDASGLASGVYLYRVNAGDFTQVKKMMLVK